MIDKVFAQPSFPQLQPIPPDAFDSVDDIIFLVVRGLLLLSGAFAVLYIIWSGFQFITSAGNPEQAQRAKNGLIYAVVGLLVIALSYTIVSTVIDLVGPPPPPSGGGVGGPQPR